MTLNTHSSFYISKVIHKQQRYNSEPCKMYYTLQETDAGPAKVKMVNSEIYSGGLITRSMSAMPELKRRIGLGFKRADDLARLWRGAAIRRNRQIELLESLVGSR